MLSVHFLAEDQMLQEHFTYILSQCYTFYYDNIIVAILCVYGLQNIVKILVLYIDTIYYAF